jgi:DNA-binding MarR family transcriptional regulator
MTSAAPADRPADFRWLTTDEQRAWRSYLAATLLLTERLERDLKSARDLSLAEYEILVRLSEAPGRRLRMSELASRTLASKSRLSHQVSRMEADGLLRREQSPEDRRGAYAVLTDAGWALLVDAAPEHVQSVRTQFVDALTTEEFAELGRLCQKVVDHLGGCGDLGLLESEAPTTASADRAGPTDRDR